MNGMLTTEEVAERVKKFASLATVRAWIRRGELPATPLGRGYGIEEADLDAFLKARKEAFAAKVRQAPRRPRAADATPAMTAPAPSRERRPRQSASQARQRTDYRLA
jgi:excisionase family DNA binding protein